MLIKEAGQVVERENIAREVLGRPLLHFDRSIDTHISRLRRKLGAREDGGERIVTLRGVKPPGRRCTITLRAPCKAGNAAVKARSRSTEKLFWNSVKSNE